MSSHPSIIVRLPLEIKIEGVDYATNKVLVSVGPVHGPYTRSMLIPGESMLFTATYDQ